MNGKIESLVQASVSWSAISNKIDSMMVRCEENLEANNRILNWIEETNAAYSLERPSVCLDEMVENYEICDDHDKEKRVNNYVNFLNNFTTY